MKNIELNIGTVSAVVVWLFVIIVYAVLKRSRNRDKPYYDYFIPNLFFKMAMGMLFALIYIFYYGGGDTTAYWDGGIALSNLLLKNPGHYVDQLFTYNSWEQYWNYYDYKTGYPPSWIYKEAEGFFICKIVSIFALVTLKSYFATTLLFSFFIAIASWKIYEVFRSLELTSDRNAAIAILFIPSSTFWCTGIMKDTVILYCLFYFLYFLYKLLNKGEKNYLLLILGLLLMAYLILQIRPFVLVSIVPPILIAISNRLSKYVNNKVIRIIFLRIGSYSLGILIGYSYLSGSVNVGDLSSQKVLNSALVTQQDFANNKTYGDKKYSIGEVDGSVRSLLTTAPMALMTGLYRPFLWESRSILMLFSGIESILLLVLTARFLFSRSILKKLRYIGSHEMLLFSVTFTLIFAYFVGFTSGLFGTLIRFKAPLLPFLVFILMVKPPFKKGA